MRRVLFAAVALLVLVAGGADARRALAPEASYADFSPAVSPDGTRVAFIRVGVTQTRHLRNASLYTVGSNGRGVVALTRGSAQSFSNIMVGHFDAVTSPSWAPDGRQLVATHVYTGTRYDYPHSELVVIDANGTSGRQLTTTAPPEFMRASTPAWSRSRNRIAFAANGLWVINPDGSGLTRLTTDSSDSSPTWSPDGSRIAFVRSNHLVVMNADGSNIIGLTSPISVSSPAWSPAGSEIAFAANVGSAKPEIYTTDVSSFTSRRLTTNPADDATPAWTPDGRSIVFTSGRGRGREQGGLWIMNADGSNQRPLIPLAPRRAANGRRCTVVGTAVADVLDGTGNDVLCAFAGNDKVFGRDGNDVLDGGKGKDVLDGGLGNDLILARDGRKDTVRGGPGFDRAQIDKGVDQVSGVEKILP